MIDDRYRQYRRLPEVDKLQLELAGERGRVETLRYAIKRASEICAEYGMRDLANSLRAFLPIDYFTEGDRMTDNEFNLLMTIATILRESGALTSEEKAKLDDAMAFKFARWPYVANSVPALEGEEA